LPGKIGIHIASKGMDYIFLCGGQIT
jgi:hypothetical protein